MEKDDLAKGMFFWVVLCIVYSFLAAPLVVLFMVDLKLMKPDKGNEEKLKYV